MLQKYRNEVCIVNVIQKINLNYDSLTKSELKIAKYILDNPKSIELYTIVKIADLTFTSKSAVLRFCQKLGYQGYSEFRYDIINFLHVGNKKDTVVDDVMKIAMNYSNAITLMSSLDKDIIEKLVVDIYKSNDIYNFGIYKSSILAQKLKYNLIDCGKSSHVLCDSIALHHTSYLLKADSLFIIFSLSGNSKDVSEFLNETKHLNYTSYLITCKKKSALSKVVDSTIVLPSIDADKQMKLDEHSIVMVFIEILSHLYLNKYL